MTTLRAAYQECQAITRREARNFYYAFLTLPGEQRRAIYVAYAFCRHCDDAVDTALAISDKLALLNALRQRLSDAYEGRPHGMVFLALADVARKYNIPQEYFQGVISGVESDLVKTRYQTFDELRQYCYQVASVVGLICVHIFGYSDERAKPHAVDLGLAMQLTNIMRDVREDYELGRIYLPQEDMARFGYSEADLRAHTVNPAFASLMRFEAERARRCFDSGFKLLPYLTPRSRACPATLGYLYLKALRRIEAANYDVFTQQVRLSAAEKLRIMTGTWLTNQLRLPLRAPR